MEFLIQGFVIGLSVAAPVGPVGLLCIQRTLLRGSAAGFASGLGAATADAFYGGIAGIGSGLAANFLADQRMWIHLLGGGLLLWLGMRGLFRAPAGQAARTQIQGPGIGRNYLSILLLTLANPMTILSFSAVFSALGVGTASNRWGGVVWTVGGVFLGSASWWLILSGTVGWLRGRLHKTAIQWVGRTSAIFMLGFGVWGILSSGAPM